MPKRLHNLGRWMLDGQWCDVVLDFCSYDSDCSWPTYGPPLRKHTLMRIGCASREWSKIFGAVIHESVEFVLSNMGKRFKRTGPSLFDANRNIHVVFPLTHEDFDRAIEIASDFSADVMPAVKSVCDKRFGKPTTRSKR